MLGIWHLLKVQVAARRSLGGTCCFNARARRWTSRLWFSLRQVELFQQRHVSRVVVQALQQGLHSCTQHAGITLGISSVQPLERFVGLVAESINRGDLERITGL